MTTLDWHSVQVKLLARSFPPGPLDGLPGKTTYGALLGFTASRQPDAAIRSMGPQLAADLPQYGIDASARRLGEFLAETCHETAGYTRFEENLRYSARRLMAVWPSRFKTLAMAAPYAWDPSDPDREDISLADLVYGSRMGNQINGTNDDDGWEHRGSGLLMHTGEAEYETLQKDIGYAPDDVRDPAKSVLAACDFWRRRDLNGFIDRGDYTGARKSINGGLIGLDQVTSLRVRALEVLT